MPWFTGNIWGLHSSDTGSIQHGHQSDQERHNGLDQSSDGNYDSHFHQTLCICSRHRPGTRIFASILKWLFDKEHDKTMAVMIGLMAGALHKLWPWQQKFEWTLGENSKTLSKPISPFEYPENPQLALAVVFITGLCLVWILEREKI